MIPSCALTSLAPVLRLPAQRLASFWTLGSVKHCVVGQPGGLARKISSSLHPRTTLSECASSLGLPVSDVGVAKHLDSQDELKDYRSQFHMPQHEGKDVVYLCGNSLGLQHVGVEASVQTHLKKWRTQAVAGHFEQPYPWFEIDDVLSSEGVFFLFFSFSRFSHPQELSDH